MIEFIYGDGAEKITLKDEENGSCRITLRIPARGFAHDSLDIKLDHDDLGKLYELLISRQVSRVKLGKSKGLFREYLLIEREHKNSRFKFQLNSWLLVLGASLGDRIAKEDALDLAALIESNF